VKVLVACEFSGTVREAFAASGHDAWSCDLLPTERPGNHIQGDVLEIQGDVLEILGEGWDLMIAHPTCTYLANSGVRHMHDRGVSRSGNQATIAGSVRWVKLFESAEFFRQLLDAPIPKIAIENPIPHKYARQLIGRKYDQLIQPWQFGHGETKATCLWLKNLPLLSPTDIVSGREARIYKMSPGPDRWKKRSVTYQGIANAMASQWGE
jgi:hypothetical protein